MTNPLDKIIRGVVKSARPTGGRVPDLVSKISGLSQVPAPQDEALRLAQQRAALPVKKGGLGLPKNNTAAQRAKAMDFTGKGYHGSLSDIKKFLESKASTESHAGRGTYITDSPEDASLNYASIFGPDVKGKIERSIENFEDGRSNPTNRIEKRFRDENLTPLQQEILLANTIRADNLGVVYPLLYRSDKAINLDFKNPRSSDVGPFEKYDPKLDEYTETAAAQNLGEALREYESAGGNSSYIHDVLADSAGEAIPAVALYKAAQKGAGNMMDEFTGDIISGGVAGSDFVKNLGVDQIEHTPTFRNQQLNLGTQHTVAMNPDNIRVPSAAFDPFRRTAAIAAAMGVAAPDLLAAEPKKKAKGGAVSQDAMNLAVMNQKVQHKADAGIVLRPVGKAIKNAGKRLISDKFNLINYNSNIASELGIKARSDQQRAIEAEGLRQEAAKKVQPTVGYRESTTTKPDPLEGRRYVVSKPTKIITPPMFDPSKHTGANTSLIDWDQTSRNANVTGVSGYDLPIEIVTPGGYEYALDAEHIAKGIGGASGKGIANRVADRINISSKEGVDKGGTGEALSFVQTMGEEGANFSSPIPQFMFDMVNHRLMEGRITQKDADYITRLIQTRNPKVFKDTSEFAGFNDLGWEQFHTGAGLTGTSPGKLRTAISDVAQMESVQKLLDFNIADFKNAITADKLKGVPKGNIGSVVIQAPERGVEVIPNDLFPYKSPYSSNFTGTGIAQFPKMMSSEALFYRVLNPIKEELLERGSKIPYTAESLHRAALGALGKRKENISQIIDPRFEDDYGNYFNELSKPNEYKEGGEAKKPFSNDFENKLSAAGSSLFPSQKEMEDALRPATVNSLLARAAARRQGKVMQEEPKRPEIQEEATVKPYNPTFRQNSAENIQRALEAIGASKPRARNLSQGVMGVGGIGVADFVPFLGTGLAWQEGIRNIQEANRKDDTAGALGEAALMSAMTAIGVGPALKLANHLAGKVKSNKVRMSEAEYNRILREGAPKQLSAPELQRLLTSPKEQRLLNAPKREKTANEMRHELAQYHATLPKPYGLELPPGNTAAQRLEAMGFTEPGYHATGSDILKVDPSYGGKNDYGTIGQGFYIDPSKNASYANLVAKINAENSPQLIMPLRYNPNNLYDITDMVMLRDAASSKLATKNLKKAGYSGTISKVDGNPNEIAMFDPDDIRSRFAAGDPFRRNAAIAAATGSVAPDLLAEEYANGGEVTADDLILIERRR